MFKSCFRVLVKLQTLLLIVYFRTAQKFNRVTIYFVPFFKPILYVAMVGKNRSPFGSRSNCKKKRPARYIADELSLFINPESCFRMATFCPIFPIFVHVCVMSVYDDNVVHSELDALPNFKCFFS